MSIKKLPKAARAMPFAHFFGFKPGAEDPSDPENNDLNDNERDQRDDETADEYAKRMEELDDKEEKARKAEEEKEKEREARSRAEDPNDDDDAEAEDKADDEETDKRAGRANSARQRERVRCAAIVAAGIRSKRVNLACSFAFDTRMTSAQAISALTSADIDAQAAQPSEPRRSSLASRMAQKPQPNPGADSGGAAANANPARALADRIVAVAERVRGK